MSLRSVTARRLGVSAAPVIACLVLFLVGVAVIIIMYRQGQDNQAALTSATDELAATKSKLAQEGGRRKEWEDAVGVPSQRVDLLLREEEKTDFMAYLSGIESRQRNTRSAFESALSRMEKARAAANSAIEDLDKNDKQTEERIRSTIKKVYATQDRTETTKKTMADTLMTEQERTDKAMKGLEAYQEEYDETVRRIAAEKDALIKKYSRVEEELHPPPSKKILADGRIAAADVVTGIVSIDLGLDDRVRPGMVFKVFRQDEAGALIEKGKIRVTHVIHTHRSLAGTIEIKDVGYPFVQGDLIDAPDFPEIKKIILIGTFDEDRGHSREEVVGYIKKYGGIVVEEVDIDTDFVVAGDLSEDREEWREKVVAARDYRVPIMRLRQFLKYVSEYIY